MTNQSNATSKTKTPIPKEFVNAYETLSKSTRDVLGPIIYQIMLVLRFKEKRKNKNCLESFSLKQRDINKAVDLVIYHTSRMKGFRIKNTVLADNLGSCPESKALEYYDNHVEGEVTDKNGDKVILDEGWLRFLYKNPDTQKHEINSAYYLDYRGKRLPWIRYTIENTKEIYELRERSWSTFYYVGTFIVPLHTGDKLNYFFIVTRKESGQDRRFVTAWHFEEHIRLLKNIEPAVPFRPVNGKKE